MPIPHTHKNKYLSHYDSNTEGLDYIVGDIHGCWKDLLSALVLIGFDANVDRLFSVGDLVDRGPYSYECLKLIYEPWFYAVKGNHEQMLCESLLRNNNQYQLTWLANGGQWSLAENLDQLELGAVAKDVDKLPLVITVGEGADRFNIVHAELKYAPSYKQLPVTDGMIDNWVFSEDDRFSMIWGRSIIGAYRGGAAPLSEPYHHPTDLSITYVGHTPLRECARAERHIYLDTGAVYHHTTQNKSEQNQLTFACPARKEIYSYSMLWKTLRAKSFDNMLVYS